MPAQSGNRWEQLEHELTALGWWLHRQWGMICIDEAEEPGRKFRVETLDQAEAVRDWIVLEQTAGQARRPETE